MKKRLVVVLMALLGIFLEGSIALAASPTTAKPIPVEITIPEDIENSPDIVSDFSEDTWECDGVLAITRWMEYFLIIPIPTLTYWNQGSVSFAGVRFGQYLSENLTNYAQYDTFEKLGFLSVGDKECRNYEFVTDPDTNQWTCKLIPDFQCEPINRYLSDKVVMIPPPATTSTRR